MPKFTDSLIGENLEVATEYFKSYMASANIGKDSKTGKQKISGGSIGFIPFNINFVMDGISGIKIYNELVFNTSFLPSGYTKTLDFIVTGVDHKLKDGDWETDVKVTLIPKTDGIDEVITGSLSVKAQKESYTAPPPSTNPPPSDPGVISGTVTDNDLWIYLTWQQGEGGAAQHYKIAKGTRASYGIPVANIINNWPGNLVASNGVQKSDINSLYTTNPQKLAQGFIDVWKTQYKSKTSTAPSIIDSAGSNTVGLPYSTIKAAFTAAADPSNGIGYSNLVNFAYIENSFQNDSKNSNTYQGMFQMNKGTPSYKAVLDKYNDGQGRNSSYTKYGTSDFKGFMKDIVPLIISKFNSFKSASGYPS
jgi:hypothetical protein